VPRSWGVVDDMVGGLVERLLVERVGREVWLRDLVERFGETL
jgi:hypothetical protein